MSKSFTTQQQIEAVLLASFQEGSVAVPLLLLKNYRALQLSEIEVMTLIHLISFWIKKSTIFQPRMRFNPACRLPLIWSFPACRS